MPVSLEHVKQWLKDYYEVNPSSEIGFYTTPGNIDSLGVEELFSDFIFIKYGDDGTLRYSGR
jgi:hypothetical protein